MINKDLPIGTVVLLRGGLKKVMITGYSSVSREDSEKVYDYNGCIFPEGFMENVYVLFDASQIEEIVNASPIPTASQMAMQNIWMYSFAGIIISLINAYILNKKR